VAAGHVGIVSVAAGRQIQSVDLTFESGAANGPFRGFVDSVSLTHPASG